MLSIVALTAATASVTTGQPQVTQCTLQESLHALCTRILLHVGLTKLVHNGGYC